MRLERMNWLEAEAYFASHDMALLTTGSIECHGKHNALGTDTLIPMKLLELVEQRSDVLMTPTATATGIWTIRGRSPSAATCWRR